MRKRFRMGKSALRRRRRSIAAERGWDTRIRREGVRQVGKAIPQETHPTLARDDEKGKYIIELESVKKLENPVPLAKGDLIRGVRYTTFEKLLKAKTTQNLW